MDELQILMTLFAVASVVLMVVFGYVVSRIISRISYLKNAPVVTVRARVLGKMPSEYDKMMRRRHGHDCDCGCCHEHHDTTADGELPIDSEMHIVVFKLQNGKNEVIELNVPPAACVTFDENEEGVLTYRGTMFIRWEHQV